MSDEYILEHIKEAFPPKIEAQLLEIEDTDVTTGKVCTKWQKIRSARSKVDWKSFQEVW